MFGHRKSIRTRLVVLASVSLALIIAIVASTRFTDKKVDRAYQSIDAAQKTIYQAKSAIENASLLKDRISEMLQSVMQLRVLEKTYLQFQKPETKALFDRLAQQVSESLAKLKMDRIQAEYARYHDVFSQLAQIKSQHSSLKQIIAKPLENSEQQLSTIVAELEQKQARQQMDGADLSGSELEMMNVTRDCKIVFLKLQNIQQLFLSTGDAAYVQQYKKLAGGDVQANIRSLREFSSALGNTNFIQASKAISSSLDEFVKCIDQSLSFTSKEMQLEEDINNQGEAILKAADQEMARADASVAEAKANSNQAQSLAEQAKITVAVAKKSAFMLAILVIGSGLGIYSILFLGTVRSIDRSLHETISDLQSTSQTTSQTARSIHDSSQALSEGSRKQAAALKETSSSLDQMAAVTRQNAENAANAKNLSTEAHQAALAGTNDVRQLTAAMDEISSSSDGISRIIKNIDDIAFQTNILALNAAVEAARAGEAGLSFAVVADEVRNLALRSASAARETNEKIQDSISKSGHAVELSAKVTQSLDLILNKALRVDELVATIAAASQEQRDGIARLNTAVAETDRVTQANATRAAESASTAADLHAGAKDLEAAVSELMHMVGGNSGTIENQEARVG